MESPTGEYGRRDIAVVYFISNTLSVSGRMRRAIRRAEAQFVGETVTCRKATDIKDYPAFFDGLAPEDSVVLLGGDGTLNYLINAIDPEQIKNPVYTCKAGTGNDYMRDMLDNRVKDGTLYRINDTLVNLPVAEIDGKTYRFLNNCSFGIDGRVCSLMDDLKAKGHKRLNYTVLAAWLLFVYKPVSADVTVDGETRHFDNVWLAPTMNGRFFGGGMKMAPEQDRMSDKVTFGTFSCKNRLLTMLIFPQIFSGAHVRRTKYITMLEGNDIEVSYSEPRDAQMDGEVVRDVTSYRVHKEKDTEEVRQKAEDEAFAALFS